MLERLAHHHDTRFLATHAIETLALMPDKKHIFCHSTNYCEYIFEIFDAESGERLASKTILYQGFGLKILLNTDTNELFYWASEGGYSEIQTFYIHRVAFENGVLTVEKTGASFATKGYYPHVLCTNNKVYIAQNNGLKVLDANTNSTLKNIETLGSNDSNDGSYMTSDAKYALFGSWNTQEVTVFDLAKDKVLHKLKPETIRDSHGMHFLQTNEPHKIIMGGKQNIGVWDILQNKEVVKIKTKDIYNATIIDMQISPDSLHLGVFYAGPTLALYRLDTGEQIWCKTSMESTISFFFSADSQSLFINKGKTIAKIMVKNGDEIMLTTSFNSTNIQKLYTLPLENRLLAFSNMKAVHLNAKTGATEDIVAASSSAVFSYNPREADFPKNFIISGFYSTLIGSASVEPIKSKIKPFVSSFYGLSAVSSEYIVTCHNHRSSAAKKLLQCYDLNGKNPVTLAQSDKNIPLQGIEFLGKSQLLAGVGDKLVTVWDIETQTEIWRVATKKDYNPKLFTHEDGTYFFVKSSKESLTCYDAANGSILWEYAPRKEKPKDKKSVAHKTIEFKSVFGRNNHVLCLMQNGDLRCLDLATGAVLHNENLCAAGSLCAALAPDNTLYLINNDTSVAHYDLKDWLGASDVKNSALDANKMSQNSQNKLKNTFTLPENHADAIAHFEAADWNDFDWKRDAKNLIEYLTLKENIDGVGYVHHFCMQKLLEQSKNNREKMVKLAHRYGHLGEMVAFGVSPDGQYLATGSWVGEDYYAGGELMIWEIATGRCVNKMAHVNGGIGWPDYAGCLQWSPDSRSLGMVINTNGVAVINPFADIYDEDFAFYETDGWSRPPQWCWQPEGKAVFIACWTSDAKLPGCVCPLDSNAFPLTRAYGFNANFDKNLFTKKEIKASDNQYDSDAISPLTNFKKPKWSSNGFLFGTDNTYAYTLNPQTRALETVVKNIQSGSNWSPNGDYLLAVKQQNIEVLDKKGEKLQTINVGADLIGSALSGQKTPELEVSIGDDGQPTLLFGRTPVKDIERIYCFPNAEINLFAAAVHGEFGYLAFYKNFKLVSVIKTNLLSLGTWSCDDMQSVAFSPDAKQVASLSDTNEMTIWTIETGEISAKHHFTQKITGILWAQKNRIIGISETDLIFYTVENSSETAHYSLKMELDKPDLSYSPLGKMGENFDVNPFFPIEHDGETHWIGAFETGLVICADALLPYLNTELCFTMGNRFALPYAWAAPNIVPDLQTALQSAADDVPLSEKAKTKLLQTMTIAPEKAPNDYFLTVTKKEFFGKKFKKGKFEFDKKEGDYWEAVKKGMTAETLDIAIKKAKDYQATEFLKGAEINAENLQAWVGKVIFFAETYSPNTMKVGSLLAVYDAHCTVMTIDFDDDGRCLSSGGSNGGYEYYTKIGLAVIR